MDIALQGGDLILGSDGDIKLESEYRVEILRRAVRTPLTYIMMPFVSDNELQIADADFGNGIYTLLSEPLDLTTVAQARTFTQYAVDKVDNNGITIDNVDVIVPAADELEVWVGFSLNGQRQNINVPLNV